MVKKELKQSSKLKNVSYKKPLLKKEGCLRDITAGVPGSFIVPSPKRKSKKR